MSKYRDTRKVKARVRRLFRAELGFLKSAKLARKMVIRRWGERRSDNYDQQALSVLIASANALRNPLLNRDELLIYLACHQKANRKIGFFSKVATSGDDRLAASKWFFQKAEDFARRAGCGPEEDRRGESP